MYPSVSIFSVETLGIIVVVIVVVVEYTVQETKVTLIQRERGGGIKVIIYSAVDYPELHTHTHSF